jgi:hypothetical protein
MTALVQKLAPGGRLIRTRRLRGGLGSQMNVLRIEDNAGHRSSVVLRRYVPGWRKSTPEGATYEFRVLALVDSAGIPAPRRLLLDAGRKVLRNAGDGALLSPREFFLSAARRHALDR